MRADEATGEGGGDEVGGANARTYRLTLAALSLSSVPGRAASLSFSLSLSLPLSQFSQFISRPLTETHRQAEGSLPQMLPDCTMLPWRRSKFVLMEDEAKTKPKSLGAGLTYQSILTSLLRSCPDLLPGSTPFDWLGSVFQTKRQKVELNKEEPTYTVRYLGSIVTITAKGEGCTQDSVAKIWQRSNYGEQSVKMSLSVGPQGIRLGTDKTGKKKPAHLYSLNRITYCTADPCRPKILAWIYRHQVKNKAVVLRCHAVLVTRSEKARAIAHSLYQTSASAFSEFKRLKRQSDFRHCQQQALGGDVVPLMPLRRLLNGQCHYRPPADTPGGPSTTRLYSITEEEEEEEDVEENGNKGDQEALTDNEIAQTYGSYEMGLADMFNGLDECYINVSINVSDSNNNTLTFVSSLV